MGRLFFLVLAVLLCDVRRLEHLTSTSDNRILGPREVFPQVGLSKMYQGFPESFRERWYFWSDYGFFCLRWHGVSFHILGSVRDITIFLSSTRGHVWRVIQYSSPCMHIFSFSGTFSSTRCFKWPSLQLGGLEGDSKINNEPTLYSAMNPVSLG